MFVVLLTVAAWIVFAVEPIDKPIMQLLGLDPAKALEGQLWRLVSWPFSYPYDLGGFGLGGISIWSVLNLFFFWYFGQDIEANLLGRSRFLRMIVWMTLALGVLLVMMDAAIPAFSGVLAGLGSLELMIVLAWIAEWPDRRFLFNIPAWLFGLVIVGLNVLSLMGARQWWLLLHFLLGIVVCAVIARHYGMLAERHAIPHLHLPHRQPRVRKPKRTFDSSRPTVVTGPWEPQVSRDEARMNALLDKIHAEGQAALTDKERAELLELRDRLRRR